MASGRIARRLISTLLIVMGCELLPAQADLFYESYLLALQRAQPPEQYKDWLVLTHNGNGKIRWVGARFEHEDYMTLHVFKRNPNDVFFLVYPVPYETDLVKYRIVVDGLWMADPLNPISAMDLVSGINYSLFEMEDKPEPELRNPDCLDGSLYRFAFRGAAHQSIYLVGDFNDWSPYRHRLKENPDRPGFFTISLRIGPGKHYYRFLVDGIPVSDPLNNNQLLDRNSQPVAFFEVTS